MRGGGSIAGSWGWALALALAAVLLLAALAAAGLLLLRRLRRRRARAALVRRRPPRLQYPVVLAHGFLGFDALVVAGVRHEYFRGLARLARHAEAVHRPRVPAVASVATRAAELAACIRSLPAPRVNVLAHSMGGLDARYAISRLGLAPRVASLVTIGTPHLGTPVADLALRAVAGLGVRRALFGQGIADQALADLSTAGTLAFNEAVADAEGVAYASVVGVARPTRMTHPILVPSYLYLRAAAGANDGVVPGTSQRWGEVLFEIEADHWAQIGWSRHFDAAAFYEKLLLELRGRGF